MFSEQFTLALPKNAAKRLKQLVTRTRAFLLDALQEAVKRGDIRTDLPAESLLPVAMGTLQHLVFARSLGLTKDAEAAEVAETLITLLAPCNLPHSPQA